MLSMPVLKKILSYLSSLDALTAVYNDDFTIIATNHEDFFDKLDVSEIAANPPGYIEKFYGVEVNNLKITIAVTPILKGKHTIGAYSFVARSNYEIYKQACVSSIPDYFSLFLKRIENRLKVCSELNDAAVEAGKSNKRASILQEQKKLIDVLGLEIAGANYLFPSIKSFENKISRNITEFIYLLCNDASKFLKQLGRKTVLNIESKTYYSNIDANIFVFAFAELIKYHLNFTLPESTITISTSIDKTNIMRIEIQSKRDIKNLRLKDKATFVKCSYDLANILICYRLGGRLSIKTDDNVITSEVSLPAYKRNRGFMLSGNDTSYLSKANKSPHTNLIAFLEIGNEFLTLE